MKKYILIFILLLGATLRLYRIASYPPLNADEAAIGYNTYSLIKTGKDEHGNSWPIHFQSFGDYKPGGYFYLVLPFVAVLGLNTLAVRLPAVILAIITIYLVYKLAVLIWDDKKLGLIWALVLAISPWHLHFSRGGWESNVAVFFLVLGTYFFYKYLKTLLAVSYLLLAILFFIASMYVYHSARIIAPLLFLGLSLFNFKKLWSDRKQLIFPIIFGFLLTIPMVVSFLGGGASSRFSGVGILADSGPLWRVNELRAQHNQPNSLIPTLLHNRYLGYTLAIVENYFSHFNGNFLFISGDEVPRSKVPGFGVMYLVSSLGLAFGLWILIKKKFNDKYLPVLWLLISPLASALTFQAPSALRALSMTIPLTFLTALGLRQILTNIFKLSSSLLRVTCYMLVVTSYLWGLSRWQDTYFTHYFQRYPTAWPKGYKEAVVWMGKQPDRQFSVVTKHDQPYILTAFYTKYQPEKMQKETQLTPPDKFGFSTVRGFGRFMFVDEQPKNGTIVKEFSATKIYEQN